MPACEDKIVQRAVAMLLGAIDEQDFHDGSYGFREGRSPHQALHVWRERCMHEPSGWIVDAEVSAFFDRLDHDLWCAVLTPRVKAGAILRLIRKWLKAGVLEGDTRSDPERGSPQGGVISPLRANIFLDHVWDEWLEREVKPRMRGRCFLLRSAEAFVIGCEREDDARRILAVLAQRFARFQLTIHPQKTRLVQFQPPRRQDAGESGDGTFDFRGLTHYWARSRRGVLGHQAAHGQEAAAAREASGMALVPCASARTASRAIPAAACEAARARPVRRYPWQLPAAGSAVSGRRARVAVVVEPAWGAAIDPLGAVRQPPRRVPAAHTQDRAQHLRRPAGQHMCCISVVPPR